MFHPILNIFGLILFCSALSLSQMKEKVEINEDCIYAVISLNKPDSLPKEGQGEFILDTGPNGTCFFVGSNKFVTANHVLNSKNINERYFYLVNSKGEILDNITIESEYPNCDVTIGKISKHLPNFLGVSPASLILDSAMQFASYGFSCETNKKVRGN